MGLYSRLPVLLKKGAFRNICILSLLQWVNRRCACACRGNLKSRDKSQSREFRRSQMNSTGRTMRGGAPEGFGVEEDRVLDALER